MKGFIYNLTWPVNIYIYIYHNIYKDQLIYFYSIIFITHFMNIEQYPLLQYIINKYTYIYDSEGLIIFDVIGYYS